MGAGTSQELQAPPQRRPLSTYTLAQLGIVRVNDKRITIEKGWTTNFTAPIFVPHRELGAMQIDARKSEGVLAQEALYIAHRVNPFKRERAGELELFLIPARLCITPRFGIITFSPDASPNTMMDASARPVSSEYGAMGADDGFVQILTNTGVVYNLNWRKFQLCMTLRRGDADLVRKIAIINNANLRNMNDIEELHRAVQYFEQCFLDAAPWCSVRLSDEDAWGTTLTGGRLALSNGGAALPQPVLYGDGRPVGAPAVAELVLSPKMGPVAAQFVQK